MNEIQNDHITVTDFCDNNEKVLTESEKSIGYKAHMLKADSKNIESSK